MIDDFIFFIEREGEALLFRQPECLIDERLLALEFSLQLAAHILLSGYLSQLRKRIQRDGPQPALIQLRFNRKQRPALHPAMSNLKIARQALRIVGGLQKLVRLPHAVPFLFGEFQVAALSHVIFNRDDIERRGVGGGVGVGISFEPVHEICALGNLVRQLAVVALKLADELQGSLGSGEITLGIQRKRRPEGIAPEIPGKAGALSFPRGSITGDQAGAEEWISYQPLQNADP